MAFAATATCSTRIREEQALWLGSRDRLRAGAARRWHSIVIGGRVVRELIALFLQPSLAPPCILRLLRQIIKAPGRGWGQAFRFVIDGVFFGVCQLGFQQLLLQMSIQVPVERC